MLSSLSCPTLYTLTGQLDIKQAGAEQFDFTSLISAAGVRIRVCDRLQHLDGLFGLDSVGSDLEVVN